MKIFKQFPEQAIELESKPFSQEAYLEGFLLDNEGLLEISQKDEGNLKIFYNQLNKKLYVLNQEILFFSEPIIP